MPQATRLVFTIGAAISVAAFAAARLGVAPEYTRLLDNVYWTVSYSTAALLAWLGIGDGRDADAPARRWFARAFTGYALGQVLWNVQVAIDRNPLSPPWHHSAAQPGPERPQLPAVFFISGFPIGQQ